MRLYLEDERPRLTGLCRMSVFGERLVSVGKRGKVKRQMIGWHGWNADPRMETVMGRLPGSGSFYWPGALLTYVAACRIMHADDSVRQIKIETISGREIARMYQ